MPTPTNLDILRAALACDSLTHDWYDFYGVTKARSDALTALSDRPAGFTSDAFDNPSSETAITLFMLAKTDGWKQLEASTERPRIAGGKWNPKFFENLVAATPAPFTRPSLWCNHAGVAKLFGGDEVDYARLVLLFEVEAGGQTFRLADDPPGTPLALSFLRLDGLTKWAKFDAILIDRTHRRFYFIEAKLGSDLSMETEKYPLVNQAVRSLEAAYWLTRTHYQGWEFRYVLICPGVLFKHKLRFYSYAFQTRDAVEAMLNGYRELLLENHADDLRFTGNEFSTAFDAFVRVASAAVRVVHWDAFADVIAAARPGFWAGYFPRLEEVYGQARSPEQGQRVVEAIRERLAAAGVSTGPT